MIPDRPINKRTRDEFEGLDTEELRTTAEEGFDEGMSPPPTKKSVRPVKPSYR